MKKVLAGLAVVTCLALAAGPAMADEWDIQTDNDNTSGTDNELIPGTTQHHDLGALPGPTADEDWFRIGQKPASSYEVVMDGTSGDIGFGANLDLVDGAGTVLVGSQSVTPGLDYSRTLRFANTTTAPINDQLVRARASSACTTCGPEDGYTIRMHETTVRLARFNNSGTQLTVLITQNVTDGPINATFFYWDAAGNLLTTGTLAPLAAHATNVFNTTTFPALIGQSGSITVAHDGPYGSLNIKSVALEPATGFSFDTPGTYVPQP